MLLAVALLPLIKPSSAQPAVRYAATAALWDDRSLVLDDYPITVTDRIVRGGHVYSDKAPGQAFLMVPFYAAYRAVGGDPARHARETGDLGLWWMVIWMSTVPLLAICVLVFRRAEEVALAAAPWAAGATCAGTLLLPFATELYGHVLAAGLLFGAWCWLRPAAIHRRPVLAGLLGGAAVAVEYPSVLLLAVMGIALLARREITVAVRFAVGGLPGVALLLWYQAVAFGDALSISYSNKDAGSTDGIPRPRHLAQIFFGSRGVAIFTPIVLLSLWGTWRLARRHGPLQLDARVALGCFAAVLWLQASWVNPWGGEMPGPRYLIPSLPFLAVGAAQAWTEHRWLFNRLLVLSCLAMALPTIAYHLVPQGGQVMVSQVRHIRDGLLAESVFTLGLGGWGWVVHLLLVVLAFGALRRSVQSQATPA